MAKRKKPEQQPRSLSTDLAIQPVYRAGMYAELQKFGQRQQLSLWPELEQETGVTVSGLDLTGSQDKALSAIQILLSKTGYQGHRPGQQEVYSSAFQWRGTLPQLAIRHSEYFEAYGLSRKGDGSYYGHQADEAMAALRSLEESRTVYYERKHYEGRKRLTDIIKARAPLIKLTELTAYQDLEEEEAEQIKAGQDIPEKARARGLLIEPSPLLVDSIDSFFLLKPVTLHTEIQQLLGSKRVSRTLSLFIEWLLTKNTATVKARKELLIDKLRLTGYVERRHRGEAESKLQEAFQVAKELQYLLDWEEDGTGMLTFQLNEQRCSRISRKAAEEEE